MCRMVVASVSLKMLDRYTHSLIELIAKTYECGTNFLDSIGRNNHRINEQFVKNKSNP